MIGLLHITIVKMIIKIFIIKIIIITKECFQTFNTWMHWISMFWQDFMLEARLVMLNQPSSPLYTPPPLLTSPFEIFYTDHHSFSDNFYTALSQFQLKLCVHRPSQFHLKSFEQNLTVSNLFTVSFENFYTTHPVSFYSTTVQSHSTVPYIPYQLIHLPDKLSQNVIFETLMRNSEKRLTDAKFGKEI